MKRLLLGVLIFTSLISQAQNAKYTALNGPYGGPIRDYTVVSGAILGLVDGQGVIRSSDNGLTWESSSSGLTDTNLFDIERDPVSGKLYALASTKLFASTDDGLNWTTVATSGFTNPGRIKKAATGSNLYIIQLHGTAKKVYRSTNGGTTWTNISSITTNPAQAQITDFESIATTLFISTDVGGVYRSTNNGLNFPSASTGLTSSNVRSMTVSGTDIYALTGSGPFKFDNVNTWTSVKANLSDGCFGGIIESGGGSVFLFNDCNSKIYSSANNGTSWATNPTYPNTVFSNVYLGGIQSAMVATPTNIFASLYSGSFTSTDGGVSWADGSTGATALSGYDLLMTNTGNLLYATFNYQTGFHFSIDDGNTWQYKYTGGANRTIYGFMNGSGTTSGTVFAYGQGLAKSINNGVDWTEVKAGITLSSLVSNDGNTFYSFALGSETTLLKSTNAGVTWTNQAITGLPALFNMGEQDMHLDAGGNIYYFVRNNSLGRTELYKINLTTLVATQITNLPTTLNDFRVNNGKLYAISFSGIMLVSTDAGATWITKNTPINGQRLRVIDDNTIYIFSENAYVSTDAGTSWVNTGNFGNGTSPNDVIVSSSNYAYISVDFGGIQKSISQVVPPLPPSGLTITGTNHERVGLFWTDNSNNEEYFIVERSKGDNSSYDSIGNILANTNITSGETSLSGPVSSQTTYYYRVRAASAAGKSAYSNEVSATTTANCAATSDIPTNRSWTGTTLNESLVGIKSKSDVTITAGGALPGGTPGSYIISDLTVGAAAVAPTSHPEPVLAFFTENCGSILLTGTNPNFDRTNGNGTWNSATKTLTIHWKTRPNLLNQRAETTVFTLNPTDPTPTAPTIPISYSNTPTSTTVSWTAGDFVQEYIIKRSLTTLAGFTEVARVQHPATSYIDNNLTTGTKYYYTITSSSAFGESAPSAETSITVSAPLFESVQIGPASSETSLSNGATWADLDDDGFEDLILSFTVVDTPLRCYRNKGDGTFEPFDFANLSADLTSSHGGGVVAGDYNNDGKVDLFVAARYPNVSKLWTNKGGGVFESLDIFKSEGMAYTPSFVDFNKDGRLDISVSDYFVNSSFAGVPKPFYIFQQNEDQTFSRYDVGAIGTDTGVGISSSWADYDNDNDMDLLVELDPFTANRLYRNDGLDVTNSFQGFTPQTVPAFDTDNEMFSESSSWGDFDNDGDLDLFQGNYIDLDNNPTHSINDMLYQNNGDGTFTRLPASLPSLTLGSDVFTNGSAWGDVDNDGDLDLLVVRYPQSTLYLNSNGTSTFSIYTGVEYVNSGFTYDNSAAFADYNKDGFLDVFIQRQKLQPVTVSKNVKTSGSNSKWLEIKLIGTVSNKTGIGARVTLNLLAGKKQIREVAGNTGFTTQNSAIVHFGLGSTATIPSLVVRWPSGITQTMTNVATNQILTIAEDITGPVAATLSPANAATGVSSAAKLELTLDEPVTGIAGKKITLVKSSDPATIVFTADVTAGIKTGNTISFTLPAKLAQSTAYEVSVDAGAFKDVYSNASLAMVAANWSFTVGAGPSVTTVFPTNNSTNVNTTANLEITFPVATTAVASKYVKVFKQSDTTSPVAQLEMTTAVVSGNKYTFTLANKLELNTNYTLSIDAGAVVDALQNDSGPSALGSWTFKTTIGPDAVAVAPALNAVNVPVNTTIIITFDKAITAVAGKKIQVRDGAALLMEADVSTTGTVAGPTYTYTPGFSFANSKLMEVTIQPGAFVDADQNDFKGVTTGQWTFTTIDATDVNAPSITFDASEFSKLEKGFSPKTLAITATDNKSVTSAVMYHRKISEKDFTATNLSQNASGKWETIVSSSYADEMGFEYYFKARDAANNKGRLPADSTRYTSRVTLTAGNKPSLDLPGGATQNSWKVIAIPHDLPSAQIQTVFSTISSLDNTKWKMLRYTVNPQPAGAWVEYPASGFTDVERGKGYFINTKEAVKITLSDPTTPAFTRDNLFSMSLVSGWNQIGNPYTSPIKWSEAIAFNNASATVQGLKTFTGGTYVAGDELAEFQGGFVFATADVANFKIPFKGQTISGGRVADRTPALELGETTWRMPITLKQRDVVNELGAIGMDPEALTGFDEHDDVTPPRFFDYLELSFDHPEHVTRRFSRDVVSTQNEYTWEFSVNSNLEGPAELIWDNTVFGDNEKELFLLDIQNQTLINMRDVPRFAFDPRQSGKFKLFFGTNLRAKIIPAKVFLGHAYPNPTTGITTIPFALPDGQPGYQVSLDVYDMMGRKINTIINGTFNSGFYNSEWDASLGGLSNGIYTYRLAVSTPKGSEVQSGKIIIKK